MKIKKKAVPQGTAIRSAPSIFGISVFTVAPGYVQDPTLVSRSFSAFRLGSQVRELSVRLFTDNAMQTLTETAVTGCGFRAGCTITTHPPACNQLILLFLSCFRCRILALARDVNHPLTVRIFLTTIKRSLYPFS